MKFTIQHVVYVIKQSVSPTMFTSERLFTIQAFTIGRVDCKYFFVKELNNHMLNADIAGQSIYVC